MKRSASSHTDYRGRMFYYLIFTLIGVVVAAFVLAAILSFTTLTQANKRESEALDTIITVYDLYLQGMSANAIDYSILTSDGSLQIAAQKTELDEASRIIIEEKLEAFANLRNDLPGISSTPHTFYLYLPNSHSLCLSKNPSDRTAIDYISTLDLDKMYQRAAEGRAVLMFTDATGTTLMINSSRLGEALIISVGGMPVLPQIEEVAHNFQDSEMYFLAEDDTAYAFSERALLQGYLRFEDFETDSESGIFSTTYNAIPYRVYFHDASPGQIKFLLLTPDYASMQMKRLIIETIVALVLLLLIGTTSSYLLTRRLYRPMQEIIARLSTKQQKLEKNEFRLIDQSFDDAESQLKAQESLLRQYGLMRIMRGQSIENSEELRAQYPGFTKADKVYCVLLRCDGNTDDDSSWIDLQELDLQLNQFSKDTGKSLLTVQDSGFLFAVIGFSDSPEETETVMDYFERFKTFLENQKSILISAFISRGLESISMLNTAYSDVLEIAEFVALREEFNVIISFDEISAHLDDSSSQTINSLSEQKLFAAIRSLNVLNALHLFDNCADEITGNQRQPMTLTNTRITALKSNIILAIYDSEALRRSNILEQSYADAIAEAKSISRIRKELERILVELNTAVTSKSLDDELCNQVMEYMSENYTDNDLSASKVSRLFMTSQSSVTRIFKKTSGVGFLEYLHALRISKAKELLLTTDLSITKISTQVGYTNALTMTRAFKRYTGTTPGSYRKQ